MKKKIINRIISRLLRMKWSKIISSERYLKIMYKIETGNKLDLNSPTRFNEKIQWLKLYDYKPNYDSYVDKITAKQIASEIIGSDKIIPTLAIYEDARDIDFSCLTGQYIIKTNHGSGGVILSTSLNDKNKKTIIKNLNKKLRSNYYYLWREKPYLKIKPRIIIEPLLLDKTSAGVKDYKFFCFDGEPKFLFIASDRNIKGEEVKFDFYDMNFESIPLINGHPNSKYKNTKPDNFDLMVDYAKKLSAGFKHIRIDLYNINGKIYFGEFTFYHFSGMVNFYPDLFDFEAGKMIDLMEK